MLWREGMGADETEDEAGLCCKYKDLAELILREVWSRGGLSSWFLLGEQADPFFPLPPILGAQQSMDVGLGRKHVFGQAKVTTSRS